MKLFEALIASLCAGVLIAPAVANEGKVRRWVSIVDSGNRAGEIVERCKTPTECEVRFIFKDNGRGPEISERYSIANDGSYTRYTASGVTTFGSRVDERFEARGTRASWQSTTERGRSDQATGKLYLPMNGSGLV